MSRRTYQEVRQKVGVEPYLGHQSGITSNKFLFEYDILLGQGGGESLFC